MNIEDLISQYIDGTLSSEAEAELHHRLAVSPEARRLFRAHIMLKGVARDQRVLHVPSPAMRASLFERLAREEGMNPVEAMPGTGAGGDRQAGSAVESDLPAGALPAAATPRSIPSSTLRGNTSRRRRRMLPWLIPIVMAGLMIGILWNAGEREPQNASTMAGRKVEDIPPTPGARGGDMVNPSSPQAEYHGDAAPLTDRDESSHTATGKAQGEVAVGNAGSAAPVDHYGAAAPTVEEKPADASGSYAQSPALSMRAEGGSGATTERLGLADRPTYEQNRNYGSRRAAQSRRSAPRDDEAMFESDGDGGADREGIRLPRNRGDWKPTAPLNDIAANENEEGIGRESLRAKEDINGDFKTKSSMVQSAPSLAASVPPSLVQSDTARGYSLNAPEVTTMRFSTLDNERYGRSIQSSSRSEITNSSATASSPTITKAYGDQSKDGNVPAQLNGAVQLNGGGAAQIRDGVKQETPVAAEPAEKDEAIDPPLLSSNGVEPSSKKGALTSSVPSGEPVAMAPPPAAPPPPPLMTVYDSSSQSESDRKIASGANASASASEGSADMMSSSNALDVASSRVRYVAGLNQRSMVDPKTTKMTHQVIVRGGVELGDAHQVYLLVGGSNYSQSGIDLFGGGGYRYMLLVSKGWNVALGGWSGVGTRYVRAGAEIPVIYQVNRVIRIEIIPTVGYARRIDGAGAPDESGSVTPGIGFGASVQF